MSNTKWTEEQILAINEKGNNILVAAAAGSGKTAVLVERIINKVINEKIDIDKILVVTFTNAAASEMRERILDAIYKKLEENPQDIHLQKQINLLNKASISTIHAFCLEVIRNNFFELDISANFRVGDATEIELIKQEVIEDLFEEKYEIEDKSFFNLIENYTNYRGDDNLKKLVLETYKFIQSTPFPEKWLKENVEKFNYPVEVDFADTVWGKIILQELFSQIQECIAKLEEIYNKIANYVELSKFMTVISQDIINLKGLLDENTTWNDMYIKINNLKWVNWPVDKKVTIDLKNIAKEMRDNVKKQFTKIIAKTMIYSSQEANKDINNMYDILKNLSNLVLEFAEKFKKTKKEKNLIDFNDIEHCALEILVGKSEEKTKVAKDYINKFVEIDVDEYQDSNLVQEYILKSISRENNIFMVGDVKQSIYRFRQARPELFLEKYSKYQLAQKRDLDRNLDNETVNITNKTSDEISKIIGEKIKLFKNFRSRGNILNITNNIFKNIMSKSVGEVEYSKEEYLNYGASYEEREEKSEIYIINLKEQEDELEQVKKSDLTNTIDISQKEITEKIDDDEQEEKIENMVLEARFVAKKIKDLLNSNFSVFDKKLGTRKIENRDISILLRSTTNIAPIYEKELSELDIPVFSDYSDTYLNSIEIQTVMSLLKIIDNPIQDIPLVTVLRSEIAGFTDNDLIEIRLADKKCSFYEAMLKSRTVVENNLKSKITKLLEKLDKWREQSEYLGLDELIWQIYIDTGYYHFVSLMPNGAMRQANLKMLFEKAKEFESTNFTGLFHFINFIDKLKNSGGDLSSAKLIGENENVVRIMSIHKSKGLEFPVVFLCNTGKKFNMQDLNENIILHQDLGIGPKFVDAEKRIEYNTLAKEAIKIKARKEIVSEEERVLYVALTRAREKLFITGISKDINKDIKEKEELLEIYKNNIKPNVVEKYKSYLDWIELVYLKKDLNNLVNFNVVEKKQLLKDLKQEEKEKNILLEIKDKSKQEYDKEKLKKLDEKLSWKYEYINSTILPTKTSVTKIKQQNLDNDRRLKIIGISDEQDIIQTKIEDIENENKYQLDKPKFLQEEKITKAQIGTLIHMCIQKLDEKKEYTYEKIEEFINKLVIEKIITQTEADNIDKNLLLKYTNSNIFKELGESREVHKEQPFYINIPAKEIYKDIESDEKILVQGIIDLYFINKRGNITLVDYKTDYIKNDERELIEKYKKQIEIYKTAIEKAVGKKVEKSYLCLAQRDWQCFLVN